MRLETKFQDEDFELGEVVEGVIVECLGKHEKELRVIATAAKGGQHTFYYSSIKKFMDDWEDAPEEKHYFIDNAGNVKDEKGHSRYRKQRQEIGNDFKTEEEADKAAEKLKAFTRLQDKGFKFEGIKEDYTRILQGQNPFRTGKRYLQFNKSEDEDWMKENWDDLDLLFSGEGD